MGGGEHQKFALIRPSFGAPTGDQTHCISISLAGGFQWSEEGDLGALERQQLDILWHQHLPFKKTFVNSPEHQGAQRAHSVGHFARQLGPHSDIWSQP